VLRSFCGWWFDRMDVSRRGNRQTGSRDRPAQSPRARECAARDGSGIMA
jgi:hypothetical protein